MSESIGSGSFNTTLTSSTSQTQTITPQTVRQQVNTS